MTNETALQQPIYVTKPFLPPLEEYVGYLERIWENGILTNNGPLHQELEAALGAKFGWRNVSLFANGHLALETALKALDMTPGGEIITTPFTFVSTAAAIVNQGFVPVFCDIGEDFTIDVNQIEGLITEKTVAILPVHVYGFPCDVKRIAEIADRHSLKVVYDAAHALGVTYEGKDIASYGDISMFSFHATKLFHTIEGGALVFSDAQLKKTADVYKNFGITGPETIELVGINAKMSEFAAAMGLSVIKHFGSIVEKRRIFFERYAQNLRGEKGVRIPSVKSDVEYNYAYMPVLIEKNRQQICDYLSENNVFARKYFYPSLTKVECYKKFLRSDFLVNVENISERIVTLPIYPALTIEQVDYICDKIIGGLK